MTSKKLSTLLVFVQDETGSMSSIWDKTISAFNEYFSTLKKEKDLGNVTVQAWQFCTSPGEERVRQLHNGPLSKVPKLTKDNYSPRGVTPLYDAVGTAMQLAEKTKVDRYLFVVQTDGLENDSKDFNREQVAKMVAKKEKAKNWTIVFLGAGIDNWAGEAMAMGSSQTSSMAYAAAATPDVYRSLSGTSSVFLSSSMPSDKKLAVKTEKLMKKKTPKS